MDRVDGALTIQAETGDIEGENNDANNLLILNGSGIELFQNYVHLKPLI